MINNSLQLIEIKAYVFTNKVIDITDFKEA